ncbi:MAG: alanine--tRNA ligase [Planctomycetaceae bacterium]
MKTDELREKFLAFFESKGCVRRPSDVLAPKGDPTVLFTPAGMNQFKEQFLGVGKLDFTRAVTCQKCLRTGDISNVGATAYHHTFFEMLGNFSFGDYFKQEAITWAWEFLTDKKWLGLDPDCLTASVYKGAHGFDEEAYDIWKNDVGLNPDRIACLEEDENFWPASAPSQGPDGVCGPCSEIFYHPPGGGKEVEIWNLVFTQFNRVGDPPDNLRPLPKKNIDTGMGLERTAAVLQGVESNFEIDILRPLCEAAGEAVGVKYAFDRKQGRPLRRIADHIRAVTFAVHEGVQPGPKEEGYVIKQLLRRAVLEGYLLGRQDPFLHTLVAPVIDIMTAPYPELSATRGTVEDVVREEERAFLKTIERGLSKFETCVESARKSGDSVISGDIAFDLHQTDGFLIEISEALAARKNLSVDRKRFDARMRDHEDRSRTTTFDGVMAEGPLDAIRKTTGGTEFLGYDVTEADAEIVAIIAGKQLVDQLEEVGRDDPVVVLLNRSPFYGEAGGQVGDIGTLTGDDCEFRVADTQRDGELILHVGHLKRGRLRIGQTLTATVDADRRAGIRRAHSATHILHHALRQTLGDNATQRGSKVEDDSLRFDFAHGKSISAGELTRIEDEINTRIAEGAAVSTELMDIDDAKSAGAMALFGEKYPDKVRVVRMGDFSTELCGGTHLANTGQVGLCKIVKEELVASGVRRVTALTGPKALRRIRKTESLLGDLVALLKTPQPEDLPKRVAALQAELRETKKALQKQTSQSVSGLVDELIAGAEAIDGVRIVTHVSESADRDTLRQFADEIRKKAKSAAVLLATVDNGKVAMTAAVTKDLIARGVKAGDCIKVAAKVVGGGGGGRSDLAEAGGKLPEKIPEALQAGAAFYREKLGAG